MVKQNCLTCKKIFEFQEYVWRSRKYCSKLCAEDKKFIWRKLTYKEKLLRLSFYFEKYVIRHDDISKCWGWKGKLLSKRGFLQFEGKSMQAHRASWLINGGKFEIGKVVCHKCDNEICSNPNHLFLGSSSENTIDMVTKKRRDNIKLTPDNVREIRELIRLKMRGTEIAKRFNLSPMSVSDIKLRKTWWHVD